MIEGHSLFRTLTNSKTPYIVPLTGIVTGDIASRFILTIMPGISSSGQWDLKSFFRVSVQLSVFSDRPGGVFLSWCSCEDRSGFYDNAISYRDHTRTSFSEIGFVERHCSHIDAALLFIHSTFGPDIGERLQFPLDRCAVKTMIGRAMQRAADLTQAPAFPPTLQTGCRLIGKYPYVSDRIRAFYFYLIFVMSSWGIVRVNDDCHLCWCATCDRNDCPHADAVLLHIHGEDLSGLGDNGGGHAEASSVRYLMYVGLHSSLGCLDHISLQTFYSHNSPNRR
jgi:hypothetical protein